MIGVRAGFVIVLFSLAVLVSATRAQPGRRPALDRAPVDDAQVVPPPPVEAEPFGDVFAREVWFMAQAAELSPEDTDALGQEALKTRARWGARIDNTALAESLRRELTPLLKDISRPGWERYDRERERLEARRRHAAVLGQIAELDEAIVLTDEQRQTLYDYLTTPSLVSFRQPQNPNPPLWTVQRLPAAISAGELGGVEIADKRIAAALWPRQFLAYKQLRSPGQQTVGAVRGGRLVVLGRRMYWDEQQRRLKIHLDRLIDTADTVCGLNDAQREKLSLAGKIDIERFGELYRAVESLETEDIVEREAKLAALSNAIHLLFSEPGSNYQKALVARLTADQAQKLAAAEGERHAFYRRALVEAVVVGFERSASLTSAQCADLTQTLNDAVTPSDSGRDWRSTLLRIVVELPEQKLRPIFTRDQWPAIRHQLGQLDEITRQLEAEAAGKVGVFRNVRGELHDGLGNVELEFEADELRLDVK
ncbi:MAG TPA: hypothetical protein VG125_21400 [Pirellulales bacterium]|jgi:hypothetical protein|nr:hypothetical protein [Pirellulales bacterium]